MIIKLILIFVLLFKTNSLYFELTSDRERCFIDEFLANSIIIINYKVFIESSFPKDFEYDSLQIKLIDESTSDLITRHFVRSNEGKFSFTIDNDGHYKICAQNVIYNYQYKIFIKLLIESDSVEHLDLKSVIKTTDITPVSQKVENIILKTQKIITRQQSSINDENDSYELQKNYSSTLVWVFIMQILLVIILGLVQLYLFKEYLIYNKVI